MAYASWSVVFGEQPSAAKWNILGTNDASFNDGTGIAADAITDEKLIYGKIRSRRGGSATNWQTAGSTDYDYSATDTVAVCGVSTLTAQSTAIAFGYTFGQNPIVLVSPTGSGGVFSAGWYVVSVSTTSFTFVAATYTNATPLQWMAIGVPA